VPLYTETLNPSQRILLRHNRAVLKDHEFIAVAPKGMNLDETVEKGCFDQELRFDASFFQSPASYNQLLRTTEFFSAFEDNDFILICQLDVWIFQDRLQDWCKQDLDYIGAPWLRMMGLNGKLGREEISELFKLPLPHAQRIRDAFRACAITNAEDVLTSEFTNRLQSLDATNLDLPFRHEKLESILLSIRNYYGHFVGVGNGGLSLRKVASALEVLTSTDISNPGYQIAEPLCEFLLIRNGKLGMDRLISDLSFGREPSKVNRFFATSKVPEDVFWSQFAPFFKADYKVASIGQALQFAFEKNPFFCFQENQNQLPMGLHACTLAENLEFLASDCIPPANQSELAHFLEALSTDTPISHDS